MSSPADIRRLREQVGELIAKHERARDIKEFSKYEQIGDFVRQELGGEPIPYQDQIFGMVGASPRIVVVSANGIGKDWAVARLALGWVYMKRGLCILTGPTERQVKQILMREVRRAFSRAPQLPGELYSMELRVDDSGECGILAFTSDNADRLTGFHHPRLLICMTEGQGIAEEAYEAAQACVTGPENRLLVYGNPTRPTGPFYRVAHSDTWTKLTIRADEHPNVISGREEIPGAVSREWIELMRDEYGEGSSIFRSRVLAQFPEESVEGLIRREWLKAAFKRWESGELEDQALAYPHILALDVSRYGNDSTILTHIQGPIVREFVTWRGASLTESAAKVEDYGDRIGAQTFGQKWAGPYAGRRPTVYVDEPGLGGGTLDVLRAHGYPAEGFIGSNKSLDPRRFLNMRSQSHWAFRELLENNKIALPPDPLLEEEALAIEWSINAAGQIQILGKDLIRKELGRSPDRLDSVVIGLSQGIGGVRYQTRIGTYHI